MLFVQLTGGLGNQLFQLAFAHHLRGTSQKVYVYDSVSESQIRHSKTTIPTVGLDLTSLGLTPLRGVVANSVDSAAKLLGLINRLGWNSRILIDSPSASTVPSAGKGSQIFRGYYQAPAALKPSIQAIGDLVLGSRKLDSSRPRRDDAMSVHYRRGDYQSHSNSIGLLADDFFIESCLKVRQLAGISRVQVFSDGNPRDLVSALAQFGFRCSIVDNHKLTPLDSLVQFSLSSNHLVLSNSSYSWWAAAISDAATVTYPELWFRNLEHADMAMEGWQGVSSQWVD